MGISLKCIPPMQSVNCFCCTVSLKKATIAICIFGIISGIAEIVRPTVVLATRDPNPRHHKSQSENQQTLVAYIVEGVITTLLYSLLLYGTVKEKLKIVSCVVHLQFVGIILVAVFSISEVTKAFAMDLNIGIITVVLFIIIVVSVICLWLVEYSYYRQLDDKENRPVPTQLHNMPEHGKLADPENKL
ncbi:uncharacterized protein [Periplaneta americana]